MTVYEDALTGARTSSSSSDDHDNTLYQTAVNEADENDQPEIYPMTPSREKAPSYRRGAQVLREMPPLTADQNGDSQCVIL